MGLFVVPSLLAIRLEDVMIDPATSVFYLSAGGRSIGSR